MKTKCANCGASASLDLLISNDEAKEALTAVFKLSGELGKVMIRYVGLFRPAKTELTFARLAKIINELLPDIEAHRIERGGQVFDVPVEGWVWAINQVLAARDAGRLTTPLKSHGYLYEILSKYKTPAQVLGDTQAAIASPATGAPSKTEQRNQQLANLRR